MNGEMFQLSSIVASSKKALKDDVEIKYIMNKYEGKIFFEFLPEKREVIEKPYIADNVSEWFQHCKKKNIQDIKMLVPVTTKNRSMMGFSNMIQGSIACFYNDNSISYFVPEWKFNSDQGKWNTKYKEYEWTNPPSGIPHFHDNTESFKRALNDIRDLAEKLECNNFSNTFKKALDILNGSEDYVDIKYQLNLPQLPKDKLHIFEAASTADVFGAMGSWNDSPSYIAYKKGLELEYEGLSSELLKNIRLAILYSVNEW